MVIDGVLALEQIRDVKRLDNSLSVRGVDVERHFQVIDGLIYMPEGVEYCADHRSAFVLAFLQSEPDGRLRFRHPGVRGDKIGAHHAGKHGLGRGDIFKAIHLDLEIPALHY